MSKIFEVTFAEFNPPSSVSAVDRIGGQDLTTHNAVSKVSPLTGFSLRPGVTFGSSTSYYSLSSPSHSNALFFGSYDFRTYVCWYYPTLDKSNWGSRGLLWAERGPGTGTSYINGWCKTLTTSSIAGRVNNTFEYVYPNSYLDTAGWKLLVMTANRAASQTQFFGRSAVEDVQSSILNGAPGPSALSSTWIGGTTSSLNNSEMQLGYLAVYDEILGVAEIDDIANAFLRDSLAGEAYVAELTGTVVDEAFTGVSGADVILFNHDLKKLTGETSTSSSGTYNIEIPFYGDYSVGASVAGQKGSAYEPFTVTGISGTAGVITFHNDG